MVNRGFAHCYRVAQTMIATITTTATDAQSVIRRKVIGRILA
jgi:hypothetical protein